MKYHYKLVSVIALCYIFTLGVIYKCMPRPEHDTPDTFTVERVFANHTTGDVPDKFKIHWRAKEKVYFKKVREIVLSVEKYQGGKKDEIKCKKDYVNQFQRLNKDMYIYSAYHDTRNSTAFVRIMAALVKSCTKEGVAEMFSCVFEGKSNGTRNLKSSIIAYEMCENHNKAFGGWILSCPVPKELLKVDMIYIVSNTGEKLRVCVDTKDENIERRRLDFGVCVPPLYGEVKAKPLVEFIEFNRILGANMFIIYMDKSPEGVSSEIRKIIRYYEGQNIITSVFWKQPFSQEQIWYHGQSLAVNDCLYKNMNKFKYLAFIDLDEFIVPQANLMTWSDIIDSISDQNQLSEANGLSFKSTFYSEDFSRHVLSSEMRTIVRTNRTKHFSYRRNKVMVRPERIFELGIHHISKPLVDSGGTNVISVPTSTAYIYHYRTCVQEFGIHCQIRVEDFTVSNKYGRRIIDNFLKIVFDITP